MQVLQYVFECAHISDELLCTLCVTHRDAVQDKRMNDCNKSPSISSC